MEQEVVVATLRDPQPEQWPLGGGIHRKSIERRSYPLCAYLLDSHPATHWADSGREAERVAIATREKEKSVGKKPRITEERPTSVKQQRASKKDNGKAVVTEEVSLRQTEAPWERAAKVASSRTSTDTVILETGEEPLAEETQSPVLGAADVLCVQKRLAEDVEKRRHSEEVCEGLREDVERAKCASLDLLSRLEACWTAYDAESLKVDELSVAAKKKEQEYQIELVVRAKKLTQYEAARISDLELIEKLEAQCSKQRTQRSQAEGQLYEVETKLTEAEGKNLQLFEETRDALTARVERCLRGYVLWQIKSHNGLRLREIEHHAAELIARSGRRLIKKLKSYLSRSRDAVANLELELVVGLRRLGLEWKLEGAATADSTGVRPVRCSHHSG
ncbi:hypothetical protein AXG93_2590s1000 [Marchantia polymorpha subsp. ruderalis]|uniref:Uncharacterized protein n=1 Tax=Marchantia polymorpha subsp. ruderalis TaxID=1480154 RepID=A0A176VQA5_MARPO|nr:hypothetical protein AXG93_2590s1000 [Marchantia polymorpha subsp. ruderalis]